MLEAILFLRVTDFSSSVPKQMLEPPPGGRRTLEHTEQRFINRFYSCSFGEGGTPYNKLLLDENGLQVEP